MAAIRSIVQKIRKKRTLFLQIMFVTLAFLFMVISSIYYAHNLLRNHLSKEAEAVLNQTKLKIEGEFVEPQTTIAIVSKTIRSMILQGDSAETIFTYMKLIHEEMNNKTGGFEFDGFFAYFEAFGGVFFHSGGWEGDNNYDPTDRPWYKTAIEADGKIDLTPIYFGARTNQYVITCVRRIFNNEGEPLGVVCLNMPIERIRDNIVHLHITEGGFGVLLNTMNDIVVHPSQGFIGRPARQVSPGFLMLSQEFDKGNFSFEYEFENYLNQWSIASSIRLDNGWILILVTPKAEYYQEMRSMIVFVGILGGILAAVLIIILVRIDLAKSKSDEQNRQKSTLLTEMEKLYEADKRTQIMLDATPLGCKLWDRDLKLIECNQAALNLFGLQNKQEFFDNFFELSPEYQPCGRLSKDMAAEVVEKAFDEGYYRFEWMHQKLNGEPIPSEITLVRVSHKEDYAVAGYIRDLREYNQMMDKIKQRDNLLNTMNEVAAILLSTEDEEDMMVPIRKGMELLGISIDLDRVQIWQNETIDGALCFVHKYEWLSEIGKQKEPVPIGLKFPYSSKPEWETKFLRGECINGPLAGLPMEDRELLEPFEIKSIVIIPLFLHDYFWGFFSLDDCLKERAFTVEEIDILRSGGLLIANAFLRYDMMQKLRSTSIQVEAALKEAQDANAAKSKFLAAMSHEIRTPMNVVLGVAESQLLMEMLPLEIKAEFEKIFDSGNLLLHIINDILDLSKIEAGKFELNSVNYDVLSLISDAVNMNVMHYGQKQLDFELNVDENIPIQLFGDELRIKQILNNLLSNAFKYTSSGRVELSFTFEKTKDGVRVQADEENRTLTLIIRVSDTGPGMSQEQIDRLFDEYSRFNYDSNRTVVGTGLGMTITRNLVQMMDGEMSVTSTPGVGSMFTVCISQKAAGSGILGKEAVENLKKFGFTKTTRERHIHITREQMPYGKVLIVDDMQSNLDVAKLLLNPYKIQIDTAESGFDAIDLIKNGNVYDIIFMDHMMPKMDGIEAAQNLRRLGYNHPIIALTANAVTGQQEMFLASGFDGFISKPIDLRQLNDALNKFIRDKERSRQKEPDLSPVAAMNTPVDISMTEETDLKEPPGFPINIKGVNEETGLALYNGDRDIYLAVLHSFVPNALKVIDKMRNVSKETLSDYTVNVHGLKSICAGIGAEKVREAAQNLELVAKDGNLSGVLDANEALLIDAENLALNIKAWLETLDNQNPKPLLERPDSFLLAQLQKSCEAYDMKGIDDAMDKLEAANYRTDASLVIWLREKINALEFSLAASRLSAYEEEST